MKRRGARPAPAILPLPVGPLPASDSGRCPMCRFQGFVTPRPPAGRGRPARNLCRRCGLEFERA